MSYVDGFVLSVPTNKLKDYAKIASVAGKVWMEHGALEYFECAGDDVNNECGVPFPKIAKTKPDETVVFSWIVFKSKSHRDRVNNKVMKDERMVKMMAKEMPFDVKRMSYGGFKVIVQA